MKLLEIPITLPRFYEPESAWIRHGPFAMWLVRALRPRRIVELGTHHGYSYFCFCQAVAEAGLSTECFAVDTWTGDEHAGFYGSEIHDLVVERNKPYADFSRLLRKTFAEALDDIADSSIDLLHVDGRHYYEDVKADFESWIPKLSPRAVVLFHDTQVRERNFGVWRFWAEISHGRRSLNFPFQHGLGVLFWGRDMPEGLAPLFKLLDEPGGTERIIDIFQTKGDAFAATMELAVCHRLLRAEQDNVLGLRRELEELRSSNADLQHALAARTKAEDVQLSMARKCLRHARRHPVEAVVDKFAYKSLRLLSKVSLRLSPSAAGIFARAAAKRDPDRGW